VNLFIPSVLNWKSKGIKVKQETNFPEEGSSRITIETGKPVQAALNIRYPSWAIAGVTVKVNGKNFPVKARPGGYININKKWHNGDLVEFIFPMTLRTMPTNDDPKKVALAYGPIVLAGSMGTEGMNAPAPYSNPRLYNDYYTYNYNVPADITRSLELDVKKLDAFIKPVAGERLMFKTVKEGVVLKPLFDTHRERYVVYWDLK
jgi:hypothetical protein